MKNKKGLMLFASLLVLIFHLWIYVINRDNPIYQYEIFIRSICFIGVDIFFLISAISISSKKIDNYKSFIFKRFLRVYLLFILFTIIQAFLGSWDISKLILTITGINLFIKGGGSFLWFLPTIMIMYILLPLFYKLESNKPILAMVSIIIIWLTSIILISLFTDGSIAIILNRIPIIMLGYYIGKYQILSNFNKHLYLLSTLILIIGGTLLLYFTNHLYLDWFKDTNYIMGIPLTLGLLLLFNVIPEIKIVNALGSITLELYALQMMFGFKIASKIFVLVRNPLLSNIITILIMFTVSGLLHILISLMYKIKMKKKKI